MAKVLKIGRELPQLKIGELAAKAGKSTRAVRLYEELGLLGPTIRTDGGHRKYDDSALVRLHWIDKLQLLGFSLHEIRAFLDDLQGEHLAPAAMKRVRDTFAEKLAEVQGQIRALETMADELSDSMQYLDTCMGCRVPSSVDACAECGHEHTIEPPVLITGIHHGKEGIGS